MSEERPSDMTLQIHLRVVFSSEGREITCKTHSHRVCQIEQLSQLTKRFTELIGGGLEGYCRLAKRTAEDLGKTVEANFAFDVEATLKP